MHYYDCSLTRHSEPQLVFHFLLLREAFLTYTGHKEVLQRCSRTGNSATKRLVHVFNLKKYLNKFTL